MRCALAMRGARRRRRILALATIGVALAACEDPLAPPIVADAFRLDVVSRFEQVLGQPEQGFIELVVSVSGDVPPEDLARIESMEVAWPIGAIISPIPLPFTPVDGELRAGTRVIRDRGLTRGSYLLTVRFEDGQVVTVERVFMSAVLDRPFFQGLTISDAAVTVEWRTAAQPHDWRLSLVRVDREVIEVLGTNSGRVTHAVQTEVTFDFDPDPAGTYNAVLVMESPYNYRELTIPIQSP